MESESEYYFKYPDSVLERLDENYCNPFFDRIKTMLSHSIFPIISLGDKRYLTEIASGKTPKNIVYKQEGVPFLGAGDIDFGKVNIENALRIDKQFHDGQLRSSQIREGDVIVTMAGTIGHCAVFKLDQECNCNQAIAVLRVNQSLIDPEYLAMYFNSELGQLFFGKFQHISSQPNINLEEIKEIQVIRPEISVQKEILAKVRIKEEEAMNAEKEADNILSGAEDIFLGELGINFEARMKEMDYYTKPIEQLNRLDFDFNNPKYDILEEVISRSDTPFVELSEVVDFIQESRNPMKGSEDVFIYIDIGNINLKWGTLNPVMMLKKDATSSRMRRVMYKGTILVSTTRPTRNAIAIVPDELDNQICSTGLAVLRCKKDMNNRFLFYALRTRLTKYQFERYCSGSGYPEINQELDIKKIRIPKPDRIEEQLEIVEKVEGQIRKAEKKQHQSKILSQNVKNIFEQLIIKDRDNIPN